MRSFGTQWEKDQRETSDIPQNKHGLFGSIIYSAGIQPSGSPHHQTWLRNYPRNGNGDTKNKIGLQYINHLHSHRKSLIFRSMLLIT